MKKLMLAMLLSSLSVSSFAATVKENEILRSQNILGLFNKACMESYLDDDELALFLSNNNFEDLNDESEENQSKNDSNDKKTNILDFSKQGKHYSIVNEKRKFFLDITDTSCSVMVKNIHQEIFNSQFKDFRKSFADSSFVENAKSFETRKGSVNYKVTAYFYFSEEGQVLPFELYLVQSNAKKLPFQLKLTLHLDKKEKVSNKTNKTLNKSHLNESI